MTKTPDEGRNYRETLFLPKTGFPMRAGLPKREPEWIARWDKLDIYGQLRTKSQAEGRDKFILHDGPPYANGHIHLGTALNKILKDFVVRSHQMMGFDAPYVPGWDCHGLPIEWKVEAEYRAKGKRKDDVPINEFRARCREYAGEWLNVQRQDFKRMGVYGEWDNPYTTMQFSSEARIVSEFLKFAESGQLYRGSKPVMWSPVEQTALAEAEVEYQDHVSTAIWVRYGVRKGPEDLKDAHVLIWTTTPWTIPASRAISWSKDISYGVYEVTEVNDTPFVLWTKVGEKLIVADALWESICKAGEIAGYKRLGDVNPGDLTCAHPLAGHGYEFDIPLLQGDHVTEDAGTGFVHTAPGHGAEDYDVWLAHGYKDIPETVGPDGCYYDHVPLFAGLDIIRTSGKKMGRDGKAYEAVLGKLREVGALFSRARFEHSYPHSWRSHAPVIFRNTPQWFIPMQDEKGAEGLRGKALQALAATTFYPARGANRIGAMVKDRPDWLISRQRAWGVPLTLFVKKGTGEYLQDEEVNARIIAAIADHGVEAWSDVPAAELLGDKHDVDEWEKVTDILDVWFDSGCTHTFTLEDRAGLKWPADVYLEGSDQHRGWFQSSLLESCATRGRAPYDTVVTHGFIMDEQGHKMAKSKGNTVSPLKVADQYGAEILRLWVASSDYQEDMRIGDEILKTAADSYRKIRNTLRYMLGALHGYEPSEDLTLTELPSLERWVLHRLTEVEAQVREGYRTYDFKGVFGAVFAFCNADLSQLFFDIRKDSLYCDPLNDPRRQAALWVMDKVFHSVVTWLAPIMPFTMEETWLSRWPSETDSVHLRDLAASDPAWENVELATKWAQIIRVRKAVLGALELERREKRLGSSLEAAPTVWLSDGDLQAITDMAEGDVNDFFADVCITSHMSLQTGEAPANAFKMDDVQGVAVVVEKAKGIKCARSWKYFDPATADPEYPDITPRDAEAVRQWDAANG